MNVRAYRLLFLISLPLLNACRFQVHHITGKEALPAPGIVYSLPRTVLRVEIPVTKTTYKAGPYFVFAKELGVFVPDPLKPAQAQFQSTSLESAMQDRLTRGQYEARYLNLLELRAGIATLKANALAIEKNRKIASDAGLQAGELEWTNAQIDKDQDDIAQWVTSLKAKTRADDRTFQQLADLGQNAPQASRYTIGAPKISTLSEPDPEHVYLIEMSTTPAQDRYWQAKLTELGILVNSKSSIKDRTPEYVVATAAAALKFAAALKGVPGGAGRAFVDLPAEKPENPFDIAETIAERIRKQQEARDDLLVAKVAKLDSNSLKARLAAIRASIDELLMAFYSKSITAGVIACEVLPDHQTSRVDILEYDRSAGFTAKLPNLRLPRAFKSQSTPTSPQVVAVRIERDPSAQATDAVESARQLAAQKGIFSGYLDDDLSYRYRIPGLGVVSVTLGTDILVAQRIAIAQFGTVFALPSAFSSFESSFEKLVFSEMTGALREVEAKTTALDPKLLVDLGDAAVEYGKAVAASRAADDEPSRLEKFKKSLDEIIAILPTADAAGIPLPVELLTMP